MKTMLPTRYSSSSCHVAHKALTQSRQPSLPAAALCTSLQFFHPSFSLSLSAVLLHVVLGLPAVIVWFCPHDVADEFPSSPSHVLTEFFNLSHLQNFFVCNSFLPTYLKYPSKTSALEDIESSFTPRSHTSRLASLVSYIA